MKKTTFYFIRHGETHRNTTNRLPDGKDEHLNETGKIQATEIVKNIPQEINVIISSPLIRAEETKMILYSLLINDPFIEESDNDLTEVNFGTLKGKTWEEANILCGKNQKELYVNQTYDFTPVGGESFELVKKRIYSFLRRMTTIHEGKKILVVTHAGIIRCLYKNENDVVFLDTPPSNASVHKFVF